MSKSKGLRKGKRVRETRNQRRKRMYAAMAEVRNATNKKDGGQSDKRAILKRKRGKALRVRRHAEGACGNIGCAKCNPAWYNTKPYTPPDHILTIG